jgi:lipoprotein signal peptidase
VFAVAFLLDRATKSWALANLKPASVGDPLFSLGMFFNSGISFSMLEGYPRAAVALSLAGLGFLTWSCTANGILRPGTGISLLWSGAVCNLADRLIYGHVIDWIRVVIYVNLADIWLCAGCAALAASLLWTRISFLRKPGDG